MVHGYTQKRGFKSPPTPSIKVIKIGFSETLKALHEFHYLFDEYTYDMKPNSWNKRKYIKYWESSHDSIVDIGFDEPEEIDLEGFIDADWIYTEDYFDCCGLW